MELRVAHHSDSRVITTDVGVDAKAKVARNVVGIGTAAYAVVLVAAAIISYRAYQMPRLDLGDMVQAVWSSAHGHLLEVTTGTGRQTPRLAAHVDPFLVLLVPFWWIWSSPLMLLLLQIAAVSVGAIPVYRLATKHTGSTRAGAHFALAYLLYPATQFNSLTVTTGMHAVSFAVPLILFAIWYLDNDRLIPFALFAVLAASTKEEIGASVGCLGLWYALRTRRWKVGLTTFALGLSVTLVNVLVVIPHYSPSGVNPFAGRYGGIGATPGGAVHKLFSDPGAFVSTVASWHKALYLALILVPFFGLWALEPLLLLGAVPDVAINLLSAKPEQTTIDFHYTAGIVPFVVAASVLGAARVGRPRRALTALTIAIGFLALVSPMDYSGVSVTSRSHQEVDAIRAALKLVPAATPVSASQSVGAYVSTRRSVAVFPQTGKAKWVIVGSIETKEDDPRAFKRKLKNLRSSPHWRTVFDSSGVAVFRATGT